MKKNWIVCFFISSVLNAQYAPAIGEVGCIAIPMNSSVFVSWADSVFIERGMQNCADSSLLFTTYGEPQDTYGSPNPAVLSLGDGGKATFTFEQTIYDGPGYDFAVFENGFTDNFLELAFVEVSSDGQSFYRFPSVSLTHTVNQIGAFGSLDTKHIHNLAGKYPAQWGTPFDLSELSIEEGLDVSNISHIRLVDVIGSILPDYANYDSEGRMINDPWPTPYESGGFDVDAVGIIHQNELGILEDNSVLIYPNPVNIDAGFFFLPPSNIEKVQLITYDARLIELPLLNYYQISNYINSEGLYILRYRINGLWGQQKLIIR